MQFLDENRVVLNEHVSHGGEEALHHNPQSGSVDTGFATDIAHQWSIRAPFLSRCRQSPLQEVAVQGGPRKWRQRHSAGAIGNAIGVQADRYEFLVYRQLRRRLHSGEIYVDDSQQHRHLSAELVSTDRQAAALEQLDIPWTRRPLADQLSELTTELHNQWLTFDSELRAGQLAHLDYDEASSTLTCRRPRAEDVGEQDAFYEQLPFCDVADVLRFVNQECKFMSALTPLQPRYAKQGADQNSLLAVITGAGDEPRQLLDVADQ